MPDDRLTNRCILVVEDEYLLAFELKEELTRAGAAVVGPAPSVKMALALLDQTSSIDGAILDFNLGGEPVLPVADRLTERGIPFMFMTGYAEREVPACYAQAPCFGKPVEPRALTGALARMLAPA